MSTAAATIIQLAMIMLAALLAVAFLVGLTVLVRPALLGRIRSTGDGFVTRVTQTLNRQHNVDRWFYRRNRLYGVLVGALALVLLGYLSFGDLSYRWLNAVEPRYPELAQMLAQSAQLVLWLFGVFALIIATAVFIRPSALKNLEAVVNRWIAPSRRLAGFSREVSAPDRWAARYPRTWGAVVALLSGLCLLALVLHADSWTRLAT